LVIWITGLAGTGKLSIGKIVYEFWNSQDKERILLNGDVLRKILGSENHAKDYFMEAHRQISQ